MRLEEEGLVDVFPQHATVVSRIDLKKVHEAHFLRRAIEFEVLKIVAKAADEKLVARLRELWARQKALHQLRDTQAFTETDGVFHRELFAAANVSELWSVVRGKSGHLDRLRRLDLPSPGKTDSILAQHRAIIDAIAANNPDKAQDCMRKHLAGTISNVDEIRRKFPQYISL
jgi:DNA-binding GntR family transcriptional regulator